MFHLLYPLSNELSIQPFLLGQVVWSRDRDQKRLIKEAGTREFTEELISSSRMWPFPFITTAGTSISAAFCLIYMSRLSSVIFLEVLTPTESAFLPGFKSSLPSMFDPWPLAPRVSGDPLRPPRHSSARPSVASVTGRRGQRCLYDGPLPLPVHRFLFRVSYAIDPMVGGSSGWDRGEASITTASQAEKGRLFDALWGLECRVRVKTASVQCFEIIKQIKSSGPTHRPLN